MTRVTDRNTDGKADLFEVVSDAWGYANYHEYAFGSKFDPQGNLFVALGLSSSYHSRALFRGWALKITPKGKTIPIASGLRSPGMNEVRKNCLVLMKGGEDNAETDSLKNSYDNFVRAIERLDSQASLGIRGKKNIELIGDYDATVKALKQFLDIAEKSAATPLQSIETE